MICGEERLFALRAYELDEISIWISDDGEEHAFCQALREFLRTTCNGFDVCLGEALEGGCGILDDHGDVTESELRVDEAIVRLLAFDVGKGHEFELGCTRAFTEDQNLDVQISPTG